MNLQPNLQKGGLTGPQLLDGVAGREGVTGGGGGGGCKFHIKNKLKKQKFNYKKI